MGLSAIISRLRKLGLLSTPEDLAADKEEEVEVFVALFQTRTTENLLALTRNRFCVETARKAAALVIRERERQNQAIGDDFEQP
jgi:hypothetical protein